MSCRSIGRSNGGSTLKLGEIIQFLTQCNPEHTVCFDFCRMGLGFLNSSRGSYNELAMGFLVGSQRSVKNVLTECIACVDTTFTGYKGGEYRMGLETPVWVDNWGDWTATAIEGIVDTDFEIIFLTEKDYE